MLKGWGQDLHKVSDLSAARLPFLFLTPIVGKHLYCTPLPSTLPISLVLQNPKSRRPHGCLGPL